MNPTRQLQDLGQSLWLDNITRELLNDGTLARYIETCAVTGLTSNPTIFQKAIAGGGAYDADIAAAAPDTSPQALFVRMALTDLQRAAQLLARAHAHSNGIDGWVSMEVSPLLADDAPATIEAAKRLHQQAGCDNLFIKIPGTPAGLQAIEEATFAGVPINVTLLFSPEQYVAAAQARMKGIERRLEAKLSPHVHSVASLFVSRWDVAVNDRVAHALRNRLGIAVAMQTWRAYRRLLTSARWRALAERGTPTQRLLWASTGCKDPQARDVLYVEALAAPDTINTMPDNTLMAFAHHGRVDGGLTGDGADADADAVVAQFEAAGVDVQALAEQLQREGAASFVKSWHTLMEQIDAKRQA